jgi:hypothetical protein
MLTLGELRACLVCGVDSKPVLWFYGLLIGSVLVGFVSLLVWMLRKGGAADDVMEFKPLEAESGSRQPSHFS